MPSKFKHVVCYLVSVQSVLQHKKPKSAVAFEASFYPPEQLYSNGIIGNSACYGVLIMILISVLVPICCLKANKYWIFLQDMHVCL